MVKAVVAGVDLEIPEDLAKELIQGFKKEKFVEEEDFYRKLFLSFYPSSSPYIDYVKKELKVNRIQGDWVLTARTPPGNDGWFFEVLECIKAFHKELKSRKYGLVYPHIDEKNRISITFRKER